MSLLSSVTARRWFWGHLVAGILMAGCHSVPPPPVFNQRQPGWKTHHGQAIWRAKRESPGITGELVVSVGPASSGWVQFVKPPIPLIMAWRVNDQWWVEFTPRHHRQSGRGDTMQQMIWLQLEKAVAGEAVAGDWHWEAKPDGDWRLDNRRTGESLTGYFSP